MRTRRNNDEPRVGDHWRLSTDVRRPLVEFQRIMRHAEQGRRFSVETGPVLR